MHSALCATSESASGTLVATTVAGPFSESRRSQPLSVGTSASGLYGSPSSRQTSVKFGVITSAWVMSQRIFSTISGVMVGMSLPSSPSTGSTTASPSGARQLAMHRAADSICAVDAMNPEYTPSKRRPSRSQWSRMRTISSVRSSRVKSL